jgi:hypothetical protein
MNENGLMSNLVLVIISIFVVIVGGIETRAWIDTFGQIILQNSIHGNEQ